MKPITVTFRDSAFVMRNKTLSNNGSPIALSNGLLLGIGHFHTNTAAPYNLGKEATRGTTKYGNTYLHAFLLYERDSPYAHCATSRPFCFPAIDDPRKCDIIQFVMSIMRLPAANDTLLISYGINDCEGATVEITEQQILDYIYSSRVVVAKKKNSLIEKNTQPGFVDTHNPACLFS